MCKNVISFVNMKGGVGKTTICVNIAGQLAKMNKNPDYRYGSSNERITIFIKFQRNRKPNKF